MTKTLSRFALAIRRARAPVRMVILLSGLGLAQQVVTARATIPFKLWGKATSQAGGYIFDNAVAASIHREGTNSAIGVPGILYTIPSEKEMPE